MMISSFIYTMMANRNQDRLAEEYDLLPFNAKVLSPTRTICEKIMSLVRFSYSDDHIADLKMKIRHDYDLNQLLTVQEFLDFFNSGDFVEMIMKVGHDDMASYKSNNQWLKYHPGEALIFKEDILHTLHSIKQRLSSIKWSIVVQN